MTRTTHLLATAHTHSNSGGMVILILVCILGGALLAWWIGPWIRYFFFRAMEWLLVLSAAGFWIIIVVTVIRHVGSH